MKKVNIKTICPQCHKEHFVTVNYDDYVLYQNGTLISKAFPYLTVDEREMLISGICPDCWNKLFKFAENDEY